jgi:hypothetical protein
VVQNAIEPHPLSSIPVQTGIFRINRSDTRGELPALTVNYTIGGTAQNGTDYTNLSASVTLPSGVNFADIFIEPVFDGQLEGDESVIISHPIPSQRS